MPVGSCYHSVSWFYTSINIGVLTEPPLETTKRNGSRVAAFKWVSEKHFGDFLLKI